MHSLTPPAEAGNGGPLARWLPALWLVAVALTVYFVLSHWHAAPVLRPAPDLLAAYVPERALWIEEQRAAGAGEAANVLYRRYAAGAW